MLSREARLAVLTAKAARKYGPSIRETAASLEELISLVKGLDPLPGQRVWPKKFLIYLWQEQKGICPACNGALPNLEEQTPHVDHLVPRVQEATTGRAISGCCTRAAI
jgi:hypothetical protein